MSKTATPARQNGQADAFPALLEGSLERITAILPRGYSADRFRKIALVAYSQNADLTKCRPASVLLCVMQAAELGLEIGKPMDLCHLVPFGGECQLLIDYKGFLALARRTGEFRVIDARVVYQQDAFAVHYNPEPVFEHAPALAGDRGAVTHAYAYARLKSGELVFEVMTTAEIEAIRKGSRSANSPAWRNHWGEMARKVVLKRLLKRQARSVEIAKADELDEPGYDFDAAAPSPAPRAIHGRGVKALEARLAPPQSEPEYQASEGVAEPLKTEDDDAPADFELERGDAYEGNQ